MRAILTDDLKDEIEDLSDEITTKITIQPSYDSSQTSTPSHPTQSKSQQDHTQLPPTAHRGFQSDILPPHQYHSTPVHRVDHQHLNPKPSGSNMFPSGKANEGDILDANTQPIMEYNGDVDSDDDVIDGDGGECYSDDSDDLTQVQLN